MSSSFPKAEKLCGQLRIASLYKEGKRFVVYPLRVTFRRMENAPQPPKVLVWAPKSLFKHAVDRNLLRRRMREAYRLQAQPLRDFCSQNSCSFQLAFNYIAPDVQTQAKISGAFAKALKRITGTNNA